MGWVTPDAPTHDELTACVQCGLCLPTCPTYRLTGEETASPRGRLTAMAAVAAGEATVDETFTDLMGFCLQCRACETACPSLVPFGRAMEGARAEIAAQLPSKPGAMRRSLLGRRGLGNAAVVRLATTGAALLQRAGGGRWFPSRLRRSFAGLRRLPLGGQSVVGRSYAATDEHVETVGLLAGCVMDPWFGPVHGATIAVLRRAGYRVEVPTGQTCCGALAAHDGAADEARELVARNAAAFAGYDVVVTNSAGCGAHLKDHAAPFEVRDVTELVSEALADGRLPTIGPTGVPVAMQDPCHLRHGQKIVDPPRRIVAAAGFQVTEIDPAAMCCGAAGVYSVLHPETSAELGRRKADQVVASGARIVASANPGCEMQLRGWLGAGYRVAHPVELYAEAIGAV